MPRRCRIHEPAKSFPCSPLWETPPLFPPPFIGQGGAHHLRGDYIATLDIGSSNVRVIVAEIENGKPHIAGIGSAVSRGMKKGSHHRHRPYRRVHPGSGGQGGANGWDRHLRCVCGNFRGSHLLTTQSWSRRRFQRKPGDRGTGYRTGSRGCPDDGACRRSEPSSKWCRSSLSLTASGVFGIHTA